LSPKTILICRLITLGAVDFKNLPMQDHPVATLASRVFSYNNRSMNLRHLAALALLLLAACGPDIAAINAANARAEAAVFRAEWAAGSAEAAATLALDSCYRVNRKVIRAEEAAEAAKDYIDGFAIWETLRKRPPERREPGTPKPGTVLPDGSIAATFLDSLAAPPDSWKESDTLDPRDREDDDHAEAVMNCHPELDSLPGFVGKTVSGDLIGQAKTKDGRDITVILVSIDDNDPKTGAATLKKAQAVAPAFVDGVQVEVMGHFEAVEAPGVWLLRGGSK
jgi:hypothetical protein